MATRINISLDTATAQKLSAMAERVHLNEGTLARSMLSIAIDEADPDPDNLVELLDGIDGALEDAQKGWQQALEGDTVALEDL